MDIRDLHFLVVEDHGFQRWVTVNLLAGLGARYVFSASDGREALLILEGREPAIDIIMTDLEMPGMDGMEFIRHVAEAKYAAAMIVLSALEPALIASVESMARAYGVQLLAAVAKPVTARKLMDAIAAHRLVSHAGQQAPAPSFSIEQIAAGLDRDEFEPFFQAKMTTGEQHAKGAEALARWRHPELGIIRPQAFIASMEASGLIETLTQVMVKAAARNCKQWRDSGLDVTVSINLSLKSLHDVTVADRLAGLVGQQGLEPRHVVFEVTESAAASDLGKSLENLSRLRMKGFGLSIDDYGTGYSSMERLTRVPFTELKIDQTFVKSATTRPASLAALESSLEMAAKLGIVAVAEGVESATEWELVRRLGCPLAQGYFIARPMEAAEFMSWVRTRERASVG